jgi:hypothetical protein
MEEFYLDNKYYKIQLKINKNDKTFIMGFEEKGQDYNGCLRRGEIMKGNFHFINNHYYLLEPKYLNDKEFKPVKGIEGYKYIEIMKFSHNMFMMSGDRKLLVDAGVVEKDFNFNSIMIIGFDSDVIQKGYHKLFSKHI